MTFVELAVKLVKWVEGQIWLPDEPVVPVVAPPVPPTAPLPTKPIQPMPKSKLEVFCKAITNFEGGPGDPNHINNNPGDFRCSPVGYLSKYGNVKCSKNGFAIFPTFELGWEYLLASVHYRAAAHPNWTILDFFNNYAPSSDNNPTLAYAKNVANACGVTIDTTLKELFA